jgi:hypothetical protein
MSKVWQEKGFADFADGTFGNAGHNIYVSRAGVLQRIHQYDFNKNGYMDLLFCNSQNHLEKAPAYLYSDPLNNQTPMTLPSDGARSGAVVDLNGNGYDDLVLGMFYNGNRFDLNAIIYFGSPAGYSENYQQHLPAPECYSVAAGDFNGDGKPDLAFLCTHGLRVFYQSSIGFEPKRFVDLQIEGSQITAVDLDADGYADLVVGSADGSTRIYWGADDGLDPKRSIGVPVESGGESVAADDHEAASAEYVAEPDPLTQVISLCDGYQLVAPLPNCVVFVPIRKDRSFGPSWTLACRQAMSVAVGDIKGDGAEDLVVACRDSVGNSECSWIYWGGENGFDAEHRTALPTDRACDVAVGDINGDGCDDIVICQLHTYESFSAPSLLYRGSPDGARKTPIKLPTEDARRVFLINTPTAEPPQVFFVNHFGGNKIGNISPTLYFGGPDGYAADRRSDIAGWGAVEAICCDINDDGYADIVLVNCAENSVSLDPGSFVFLNSKDGFSHDPSWILPTSRAHGACCADLNRDGYLDLIFSGWDNPELLIFYGNAQGFDTENPDRIEMTHDGVTYSSPRWIHLVDLNNDGWLDLVVPQVLGDRSFILRGGPEGFSMDRCQTLSVERPACVRSADLTGNGYPDLILGGHVPSRGVPHDSFVYIYWNGPEGLSQDRRCMLPANGINSMAIADFNNNGRLDLYIGSYADGKSRDLDSYIYWNRPGTGFSAADRKRLFTHSASGCVAADFDEDGWIDLAVANHKPWGNHQGYSEVWWNGPDGFDARRTTRLPTSGPHGMSSVEPGNALDRGPEETYESSVFKLPDGATAGGISWQAEVPAKTWVKAQLRFAETREALAEADWLGPAGVSSWFANGDAVEATAFAGYWLQYRLALGAANALSTPRVTSVEVAYAD